MSCCLITGGAGFIGTNLADHYLTAGREVTILDNFSRPGAERNLEWLKRRGGKHLKVVRADVREHGRTLQAAVEEADVVFHLAAQVAVTTAVKNPREDFETNALGTFNVLEAARCSGSQPIVVYSSTNKVYGKMPDFGIDMREGRGVSENRPLDPYSPYGCSKCAGDQYVLDYARIYGLKTVVFRQSCIYGPRQFGMEDQGWLAWFAIRAHQRKPVTIYGDGHQVRDVLYVHDLVEGYDAAVRHIETTAGRAYNMGGGPANTVSLLELITILNQHFGHELECSFEDWRPGDQPIFVSDISKAMADFGWQPRTSIGQGIGYMIDWIQSNGTLFETPPRTVAASALTGVGAVR